MPLNLPDSVSEVVNRSKADVQRELAQSNPFLKNSWLGAIVTACAHRVFDFYIQLRAAIRQNFPDTASDEYLTRWASIWGKQKIAASKSSGNVVATGLSSSSIPSGTVLTVSGVGEFVTTATKSIVAQSINVLDITRSGAIATVTTESDHGLANNVECTISGASNPEYNVTSNITVTGDDAFQFDIETTPPDELASAAVVSFTAVTVPIESSDFGSATNLDAGTQTTLQSPIVGVDDTLTADFGAIGGGTDQETDAALRLRLLDRIQNPVAHFNSAEIIEKAKEVAGVTRVFVQEADTDIDTVSVASITRAGNIATVTLSDSVDDLEGLRVTITGANEGDYNVIDEEILVESDTVFHFIVPNSPVTPATGTINASISVSLGAVKIYFMRDNDLNPIPVGSEVVKVKDKILEITPANTADADVIVNAPVGVSVDFTFSDLVPNTATMKTAIEANLRQFFDERTSVGVDVDEDAYRSAVFQTVDTETGEEVSTFALSSPSGDVAIASGEIGILGAVAFL